MARYIGITDYFTFYDNNKISPVLHAIRIRQKTRYLLSTSFMPILLYSFLPLYITLAIIPNYHSLPITFFLFLFVFFYYFLQLIFFTCLKKKAMMMKKSSLFFYHYYHKKKPESKHRLDLSGMTVTNKLAIGFDRGTIWVNHVRGHALRPMRV